MQISSLIDIIGGRLLNSPSISFIYSFKSDPSKVKEGDLFIAKRIDDIEIAVKNGAFAIITEQVYPIIDKEIAWIRVDSINLCIIQLLRFKLATFNLEAYYCDKISYDLLNSYANSSNKNIRFIPNNLEGFIKYLDELEDNDVIICEDKSILDKIYPNNNNFNKKVYEITNLVEHSLFEVSFSYKNIYFPKIKIASIYIPQLISIYDFFEGQIEFSKLKSFNHFKPLFLDKNFEITDFGKSDKFVLSQNNEELILDEVSYIKNRYKYAKTIFITSTYSTKLSEEQIIVENLDDIKKSLKNNSFNAAYIIGFNFDEINKNLIKLEKQDTLF